MPKRYCGMCDKWMSARVCKACGADTDPAAKEPQKVVDLMDALTNQRCIPPNNRMVSMPTKPRTARFECSDCGKQRLGNLRSQCLICGEMVCGYCEPKHPRQHPRERYQ